MPVYIAQARPPKYCLRGFQKEVRSQLDITQSSYDFHFRIESLASFCRREWPAIALFGGGFCVVALAAILLIDPAFFYPRLQTDPLNYWLKAKSLVETGHTSAKWAVNIQPFSYAAMPGVLRAPLLAAFHDFDQQLRAVQILNIPIVGCVALFSAYIFSWIHPKRRHRWVIAYAFAFTLLNPVWLSNIFLPLVDAPYAVFSMAALILSIRIICSDGSSLRRPIALAAYAVFFVVTFLLRFTAPVLLVFAAVLWRGKHPHRNVPRRRTLLILAGAAALVALLVLLNADAIFGRYLREPIAFARKGDKLGMILNVVGAGIPAQIVPNFMQGFIDPTIEHYFKTTFFANPLQTAWLIVGLVLGLTTLTGMWKSRDKFLPEILYFLAALPVLGLMMPSTSRYLKSYQAFIWVFFYTGAAFIFNRYRERIPAFLRSRTALVAGAACASIAVVGIRAWRFAGTASEKKFAVTVTSAPSYVGDVAATFRGLRDYVETLPADRTLLVSERGSMGRWKAISNRDYYFPDSAMSGLLRSKDFYLLIECGTMESCQSWNVWRSQMETRVSRYGSFNYDSVYAIARPRARALVYRIRNTE